MKDRSDRQLLSIVDNYGYTDDYSSMAAVEFDLVCSELCSRGYMPVRLVKFVKTVKTGESHGKAKRK